MFRKIMTLVLSGVLLGACTQTVDPVKENGVEKEIPYPNVAGTLPAEENPVGATAYPDVAQPGAATPYPGVDQPGDTPTNSETPGAEGPYPDPLEPLPGEENMERGEVFIDESGIIVRESFPPQYVLHLVGNLPTPCHHLRANVSQPDDQNRIQVEVYSLVDPEEICTQVLSPFENNITLGSFETGKYSVLVNGEQVAEIEAP